MSLKDLFKRMAPLQPLRSASDRFWRQVQVNERFIYGVALRYTGHPFDAEDLVQQTLEMAFKRYSQLRDPKRFKGWLFVIMRNIYLKTNRRVSATVPQDVFNEESGYMGALSQATRTDPAILYEQKSVSRTVQQAVAALPEAYQSVLILHYMDDCTYQEISDRLDIPIGTVMSRLARGKQHLKKILLKREVKEKSRRLHQTVSKKIP